MMHEQTKMTETRTKRAEWKRPQVRQMAAGQAEVANSASTDTGVFS